VGLGLLSRDQGSRGAGAGGAGSPHSPVITIKEAGK